MTIRTCTAVGVIALVSGLLFWADPAGASEAVPQKLDWAADFVPEGEDFAHAGHRFLGVRKFKGRALKARDKVNAVYVAEIPVNHFASTAISVGDLIVGVDGTRLGDSSTHQFKTAVLKALTGSGVLSVTRWRAGELATFDFNFHVKVPDLTKGEAPSGLHDWLLGPTGLNGWVHNVQTRKGGSRDARQILVTRVEEGSPAHGKMKVGDVILGIGDDTFSSDARKALAAAINEAESVEKQGKLPLRILRDGKTLEVSLNLKVLGTYSATAPFECAKTERIIDAACQYLMKQPLSKNWHGYITALGMLSAGRQDMLPILREFAHSICVPGEVLNIETHQSMLCWTWSYKCLFLSEYYLQTGDQHVLPTITEYATKIAMGQSGVGSWGHTVAARANTGYLHGHLGGYGAINQMGLTLMVALPIAEKCGVTNDEIKRAIKRGDTFFGYYVDKGAIPYGDHRPAESWFDDNGKSGSSAVMFDLIGNERGAEFFSQMALGAAANGREEGHTGCFWSHLWGGVGAARGGEESLSTFMDEMNWAFTLERDWTGKMVFQGNAGEVGSVGEAKTKWDCTGARLLQLCVPKQQTYVTGKYMNIAATTSPSRAHDVLAAARLVTDQSARKALTKAQIMTLLRDPLPAVRVVGANALREQGIRCVTELVALLDSDDVYARYGACNALRNSGYGSAAAVTRLVELIETADDLNLRLNALDALTGSDPETTLAGSAKAAIPALLALSVKRFDIDPRRLLQRRLGFALFDRSGLITLHGIDGLDRAVLLPAIRELLTVDDGRSRSLVSSVYTQLSDADRQALWRDIYYATRDLAPSGIMFADGVRISGLRLMQQHQVAEGVDLTLSFMQEARWGAGTREKAAISILEGYGANAQKALPALQALKSKWGSKASEVERARLDRAIAAVEAIEAGAPAQMKSIAPYIK